MANCHMELDENGEGKCSVPMAMQGMPTGFCDKIAYGRCPPCEVYRDCLGKLRRLDNRYSGYVPGLACFDHGGPDKPITEIQKFGVQESKLQEAHKEIQRLRDAILKGEERWTEGEKSILKILDQVKALQHVKRNLEAIIIRCTEGDPNFDWLPVILRLAREAKEKIK